MTEDAVIDLPILGGVNEKVDETIGVQPQQMINCFYRKTGSVGKRFGYKPLSDVPTRNGGSVTPPVAEIVASFQDGLVTVGSGELDEFSKVNAGAGTGAGEGAWVFRDRVPDCVYEVQPIASGEVNLQDGDVAYVSSGTQNYAVFIYETQQKSEPAGEYIFRVCVDIIDVDTGARVITKYVLDYSGSVATGAYYYQRAKVVGRSNGTASFYWANVSTGVLRCAQVALSTMTFSGPSDLETGTTGIFDVMSIGSEAYLVFEKSSGSNPIRIDKLPNYNITGATQGTVTSPTAAAASCFAIRGDAVSSIFVATSYVVTGDTRVYAMRVDWSSSFTVSWGLTSLTDFTGTTIKVNQISIELISSASKFVLAWQKSATSTSLSSTELRWTYVTDAGSVEWNNASMFHVQLVSHVRLVNGRALAIVLAPMSQWTTSPSYFAIDLCVTEIAAGDQLYTGRVAGKFLHLQANPSGSYYSGRGTSSLTHVAAVSGTQWFAALNGTAPGKSIKGPASVLQWLKITQGATRNAVEDQIGHLVLPGGAPELYDRDRAYEPGFAYEPPYWLIPDVTQSTGGTLTVGGTYQFIVVYEWKDAAGNRYQSIPSRAMGTGASHAVAALTSSNTKFTIDVPCVNLTNKMDIYITGSLDQRTIQAVVYMTENGGSVFYRRDASAEDIINLERNSFTTITVGSPVDTTSEVLYTTGGALEFVMPPSARQACIFDGRIFLVGTDDDTIWFSDVLLKGEGPRFNEILTIPAFGVERTIGAAALDDKLVLFKPSSIWFLYGTGPNSNGEGSGYTQPVRLPAEFGCTNPKSIVSTKDGVMFQSPSGLALLTRSLEVVIPGKSVEDTVRQSSLVSAATVVPYVDMVRFALQGVSVNVANYDSYHSQNGAFVWSYDDYVHQGLGRTFVISGACLLDGLYTFVCTDRRVYQEKAWNDALTDGTSAVPYMDHVGSTAYWVTHSFTTSWVKLAGMAGYQRLKRVQLVTLPGVAGTPGSSGIVMFMYQDYADGVATQAASFSVSEKTLGGQRQIAVKRQKSASFAIGLLDTDPGSGNRGNGEGLLIRALSAKIGIKSGQRPLPATARK